MLLRLSVAILAISVAAIPLAAQTDDGTAFLWSGAVAAGHVSRVHNLKGEVRAPDGMKAFVRGTNGSVAVDGLTSQVDAATTNGDVSLKRNGL